MKLRPIHFLVLSSAVSHLAHDGTRFIVSLFAIRLDASPAVIGTLGALFALLPALTSLPLGRWIDRRGTRAPMLGCAVLMVAGCALPFFWPGIPALFVTSVLVGTAYNTFFLASGRQLSAFGKPGEHVRNISVSSTGYSIAILLAPLVAGFAIDGWGHAEAFLLMAALPLVPFVLIGTGWLALSGRAPAQAGADTAKPAGTLVIARQGRMPHIFIATVVSQVAWSLYIFLMPLYGSEIGMSASRIGMVMSGFSLMTVLTRSVLPVFVRKLTLWQVLLISLAGASLCLALFPFFRGFGTLFALGLLLGIALGLSGPMALSLLYEYAPRERLGEMLGLRVTLMNTSFTIVPLISGTLTATLGMGPVFWVLAAMMGAGCVAVRERWRDPHHAKP